MLLNQLDKKLTENNIDVKIVFLIYVDLMWAPEHIKFENPDRFILMFAPITRTYGKAWKIPWTEEPGRLQSMGSLESDTTERLRFHFLLSCTGEGHGNPL